MSNFTKGPWIEVIDGTSYRSRITTSARENPLDRKVEICTVDTDWDEPFATEQVANKNLIIAAPDLYEQLDRLITFGQMHQLTELDIEPALEALAKARGQS